MILMMMIPLFTLILVTGVLAKPPTEQDQTRAGPVSDQPLCFNVTDPDAMEIDRIYEWDKDKDNLFERKGLPLSDCSESGSVGLDTCRVCEGGGQVLALCRLSNPSADLRFETNNKPTPLRTTPCVSTTTPAPTTLSTAPPHQPTALFTTPPLQLTTRSTAPPPGLIAGIVCVVLVVVAVAVAVAVAFTQRENIGSWIQRRRRTRVPTMDLEMKERAPAANGHAPPPPR